MKFPVPKTLTSAVLPVLLISWVFGIGVIEYPIGRPRRILSVFWSIVNFLIFLGFLKMANFSEITTFHGSKIAAYNYRILHTYFYVTFVATSICLAQIKAKVVRDSRHKLHNMNNRLKMLGIPKDYEVAFKAQIIQISIVFALTFFTFALDFKYFGFLDLPSESSRTGLLMLAIYSFLFAFVVDGNFTASIKYFGNRCQRLNSLLAESDSAEESELTVTQESEDLQFRRYFSVISEIHQNNSLAIRTAEKQWLLHVIREIRKIHRGVCKMAVDLNRVFGVQVLLSVAVSFGMITALFYESYIIARPLWDSLLRNNWPLNILLLMWITFYAMRIILIVDACETTSCEANRTGGLINKLLLNTAAYNEDIRDEINIFSLQLIQNPLKFTACGFFTLDYSLVHGIIGSVTTYLVIMIQMRCIYEPESMNFTPNSLMLVQTNGTY